jgi:hypothetical protein
MSKPVRYLAGTALALLVGTSAAHAAFTTENCLAKKRQAHGKLAQCRATEDAKAVQGKPADLGKCSTKFSDQLAKLTEKATKAGIGCRFRDNGNGTVSDYDLGLQWEQKNGAGGGTNFLSARDVDNTYSWSDSVNDSAASGFVFSLYLNQLNNCSFAPGIVLNFAGFAFHCDWRLPSLSELQSLLILPCIAAPCIDPAFGPTAGQFGSGPYWTSTSFTGNADFAWQVNFGNGTITAVNKSDSNFARAVRNGF